MTKPNDSETYSEEEAARRRDELAKRILRMPPQPRKRSPSKLARAAAKPAKSPRWSGAQRGLRGRDVRFAADSASQRES